MPRKPLIKHVLPENPVWLTFTRTDGDSTRWPSTTVEVVDGKGEVNFYRPIPIDESSAVGWRRAMAVTLADRMGMPKGPEYVLADWPEGYQMFDHNKGPASDPRHDPYLIGSVHVNRFRSVPEFIPHALWLLTDATMDRANCECKYCSKTPQLLISRGLGLSTQSAASRSVSASPDPLAIIPGGGSASVGPRGPRRSAAVAAAESISAPPTTDRIFAPIPSRPRGRPPKSQMARLKPEMARIRPAPTPTNYTVATVRKIRRAHVSMPRTTTSTKEWNRVERVNDHRAANANPKHMDVLRWLRKGELVWCAIRPGIPILGLIEFWPALVTGFKIKSDVISPEGGLRTPEPGQERFNGTVRQQILYKIKFLGIKLEMDVPGKEIVPYQAYHPPSHGWRRVEALLSNMPTVALEATETFDPYKATVELHAATGRGESQAVLESLHNNAFREAAIPYSVAVLIASAIADQWTPTDEMKFKPPARSTAADDGGKGKGKGRAVEPADKGHTDTTVSHGGPSASSILPPEAHNQVEYQGFWWGSERIWVDDLVRLKPRRAQFVPSGSDLVVPAAGPSPTALKDALDRTGGAGLTEEVRSELGSGNRALFLHVSSIHHVAMFDVDQDGGRRFRNDCRIAGMPYELVDEDFDDGPLPPGFPAPTDGELAAKKGLKPLMAAALEARRNTQGPHNALSHPSGITNELPVPPDHYRFRPVLHPDYELILPIAMVSGRYYARLFEHPCLREHVLQDAHHLAQPNGQAAVHLWALQGLASGTHGAMDPREWGKNRSAVAESANEKSKERFLAHWKELRQGQEQDVEMTDVS